MTVLTRLSLTALLVCALCGQAQAQLAVADASNVIQTTATAINTARQVDQMIQQLRYMESQLKNQVKSLQTIDPTSFSGVERALNQTTSLFNSLQSDASVIRWDLQRVGNDFDTLFPKSWKGTRFSEYDKYYGRWNGQITSSSKASVQAQAQIANLQAANQAAADALSESKNADGEVRQLQLLNQQLAVLQTQMATLITNISTMGRVTSAMAAASAGEKDISREVESQRITGYTNKGAPPQTLSKLPTR